MERTGRTPLRARRRFLQQGMAAWIPMVLPCVAAVPLAACANSNAAPARARGSAVASVRDWGAAGDGSRDDTEAFQQAIDSLPGNGGTVKVPAGRYRIDPTRQVRLRDKVHLQLDEQAVLEAIPNGEPRAYVLLAQRVSDVEISGGRILGERHQHRNERGEWGHGISVRGSQRVTIRDMHIQDCWGDGISIGGQRVADDQPVVHSDDVVISNVVSTGNRRQGLTIGRSRHVRVHDSEFNHTVGTLPACGIDIEPDEGGTATDVVIERCVMRANEGNGIQIYRRTADITVRDCLIEDNGGYGVLAIDTRGGLIVDNRIHGNALKGIGLRGSTEGYEVARNRVTDNSQLFRGGGGREDGAGEDTG